MAGRRPWVGLAQRFEKCLIVALVLVGVGLREAYECAVEAVAFAQVSGNGETVAGACMRVGERPSTGAGEGFEGVLVDFVKVGRAFAVPELAHVIAARRAVLAGKFRPSE